MEGVRKEDFQFAYLAAICASANIDLERLYHDDDSIDALIKKKVIIDGCEYNSEIRLQLKCTSSINKYRNEKECIFYTLPVKNYNDLASKGMPILLMLLVLPENEKAMILTKEQLLMKGTMYYLNLQGGKKSENKESVTISIPYCNIVNEEVLNFLLMRAGDGSL